MFLFIFSIWGFRLNIFSQYFIFLQDWFRSVSWSDDLSIFLYCLDKIPRSFLTTHPFILRKYHFFCCFWLLFYRCPWKTWFLCWTQLLFAFFLLHNRCFWVTISISERDPGLIAGRWICLETLFWRKGCGWHGWA